MTSTVSATAERRLIEHLPRRERRLDLRRSHVRKAHGISWDSLGNMLKIRRPSGCFQHSAEPDQSTCKEVNMAAATHATNLLSCKVCGEVPERLKFPNVRYCSMKCRNIASSDHSTEALMKRFWNKVDRSFGKGPWGDCWEWVGRVDGRGYGEIKVSGRYKKAHRLALFGHGDLMNKLFACHRCDNPKCVRPDHLFAGTALDNVRDMHSKGRRKAKGWLKALGATC